MRTLAAGRWPALLVALAVVAALTLVACGGDGGGSYGGGTGATTPAESPAGAATTTDQIGIRGYSFTPAETTVEAGTTVTWTNDDTTAHDVTSTDGPGIDAALTSTFASETLAQGDTFSHTFEDPGTYHYECTLHATMQSMHAVVIVE